MAWICFQAYGVLLFFFMVWTALNRSLLKPVSGLLKFIGSFGALTLRNIFSGIRNLCHVHGEYFIYVYKLYFVDLKNVIVSIDAEFFFLTGCTANRLL